MINLQCPDRNRTAMLRYDTIGIFTCAFFLIQSSPMLLNIF